MAFSPAGLGFPACGLGFLAMNLACSASMFSWFSSLAAAHFWVRRSIFSSSASVGTRTSALSSILACTVVICASSISISSLMLLEAWRRTFPSSGSAAAAAAPAAAAARGSGLDGSGLSGGGGGEDPDLLVFFFFLTLPMLSVFRGDGGVRGIRGKNLQIQKLDGSTQNRAHKRVRCSLTFPLRSVGDRTPRPTAALCAWSDTSFCSLARSVFRGPARSEESASWVEASFERENSLSPRPTKNSTIFKAGRAVTPRLKTALVQQLSRGVPGKPQDALAFH